MVVKMKLINIGIAGCLGRMGKELVKETINNNKLNFIGGFEISKHTNLNKKFSDLMGAQTHHTVTDNAENIFCNSDVVIDFTTQKSTSNNISLAIKQNTPIVIGTTGLDNQTLEYIKESSSKIAILLSSNMSMGVNLLFNLVQQAASILEDIDYDIEISETHHKYKIDAPSGTALMLGEYAARGRNSQLNKIKVYDRTKAEVKRNIGDIGFAVTRGGEVAGEHTVSFIGSNDRIDISHKAYNRSIFVKGAIEAAIFLSSKKNGLYSMSDVINFKK